MDELIDVVNNKGIPTGKTVWKSIAHKEGICHQTIHVWFYTNKGEILIQQRGKNKAIFPLLWDVSVAGHIGAGESIEISALREIDEEIGLRVSAQELQKIGVFKSMHKHHATLIDNEFHHTFICELQTPLKELKKQESEVEDLQLISIQNFTKKIALPQDFVPHEQGYYQTVIKKIKKVL